MAQQTAAFTVYGGTNPTVIQTVSPRVIPVPVRSGTIPHRRSHRHLGIIQMVLGSIGFLVSVCGFFFVNPGYHYFGSGIYSGLFFILTGLLGFLADKQNSKCLIIACMVMNIISTCVALIGLSFASVELTTSSFLSYKYNIDYQYAKCVIVIVVCAAEFIITIVHAGFTCASCCDCCLPRQSMAVAEVTTGNPVVIHQGPQANITAYPGQVYQQGPQANITAYPGQMYQYLPQQQYSPQVIVQQPYPQPPQGQTSLNPQGAVAYPPPYNAAFSHETPEVNPPPYSEMTTEK